MQTFDLKVNIGSCKRLKTLIFEKNAYGTVNTCLM